MSSVEDNARRIRVQHLEKQIEDLKQRRYEAKQTLSEDGKKLDDVSPRLTREAYLSRKSGLTPRDILITHEMDGIDRELASLEKNLQAIRRGKK